MRRRSFIAGALASAGALLARPGRAMVRRLAPKAAKRSDVMRVGPGCEFATLAAALAVAGAGATIVVIPGHREELTGPVVLDKPGMSISGGSYTIPPDTTAVSIEAEDVMVWEMTFLSVEAHRGQG